jgi:hypothetical protein
MTWQPRVSLIRLISEASVVDLPDPVGPVTRIRPCRPRNRPRDHPERDGGAPPLREGVAADARVLAPGEGEVVLVLAGPGGLLLPGQYVVQERLDVAIGEDPLVRQRRQLAVDADHRRQSDRQQQVGALGGPEPLEQDVEVGPDGAVVVDHRSLLEWLSQ